MRGIKTKQAVLFGLLSVAITAFIFSNSARYAAQSNAVSGGLMDLLRPLLQPFFSSEEVMHKFVRKAAHFAEFGTLGFCMGMTADGVCRPFWRGSRVFVLLFAGLGVAVTDEFIQSFFDRTSSVCDVLLDFAGAAAGVIFAALLITIFLRFKQKRG